MINDYWYEKLVAERDDLRRQLAEVAAWKEEAIITLPNWQVIAKLLNVGLGQTVHDKLIPGIERLIAERDDALRQCEQLRDEVASLKEEIRLFGDGAHSKRPDRFDPRDVAILGGDPSL